MNDSEGKRVQWGDRSEYKSATEDEEDSESDATDYERRLGRKENTQRGTVGIQNRKGGIILFSNVNEESETQFSNSIQEGDGYQIVVSKREK